MNLSAPTRLIFLISLVLVVLAFVAGYVAIPFVSAYAGWVMLAGYVVLAGGCLMKGA